MNSQKQEIILSDFKFKSFDKLRYGDTDRQGHVNNVMFLRFYETNRCELLYSQEKKFHDSSGAFVIAQASLDFLKEIFWPGNVEIGLNITKIGRTSITFEQAIFQDTVLVSKSTSVIVHIDTETKRPKALSELQKKKLMNYKKST